MKEILKSKIMMGFLVFVIGISFVNGVQTKKMEENNKVANDTMITLK